MKKNVLFSALAVTFVVSSIATLNAQTGISNDGPPKILVIQREMIKPGRAGSIHAKAESSFIHAMQAAHWPTHYLALESMSGESRALFLTGFPSLAAWEQDNQATEKNPTLAAALDRAQEADGDLLSTYESSTYSLRDDMSLRTHGGPPIAKMRYFDATVFRVRPGHEKEWEEAVNLYRDGYEKSVPDAHWAVFQSMFGKNNGGMYLVMTPMVSLDEMSSRTSDSKKFADAMGPDKLKRLDQLVSTSVESSESNLFRFSPKMSYVADDWIKLDPYWKTSTLSPATRKTASATPAP